MNWCYYKNVFNRFSEAYRTRRVKLDFLVILFIVQFYVVSGLRERFCGVLRRFGIQTGSATKKDLGFDDDVFPMASALDPSYAFHWLDDHAGTEQEREEVRQQIIGLPPPAA